MEKTIIIQLLLLQVSHTIVLALAILTVNTEVAVLQNNCFFDSFVRKTYEMDVFS